MKRRHAKQLLHLQAKRFETPAVATAAWTRWRERGTTTRLTHSLLDHKRYAGKGRPTPTTPPRPCRIHATSACRETEAAEATQSIFVVGTNIDARQLSDAE